MATILQLSETTYVNLDTVTVIRYEGNLLTVFFSDHAHALTLSAEETTALEHYLGHHTE